MKKVVIGALLVAICVPVLWFATNGPKVAENLGKPDLSTATSASLSNTQDASPPPAAIKRGASVQPYRPFEVLNAGGTLADALKGYAPNDYRAGDLVSLGESVCMSDPDTLGLVSEERRGDPTRAWAVDRVLSICEGFDPDAYTLAPAATNLAKTARTAGVQAASTQATDSIRNAPNQAAIVEAGQFLMENGQLPLDAILPGWKNQFGTAELVAAWTHASTMIVCSEGGGCGPNSLPTAAFCMNTGCRPGSDIGTAFKERLSPVEYQATIAFYNWINGQRH